MSKTITKEWLREKRACAEGYDWFVRQHARDEVKVLEHLIAEEKFDWANWLIVRRMARPQYLQYAVFAAEKVIDIFEKKYPNDKRPREAIEAARKCIEDDTQENRAYAADAAAYAYAYDAAAYAAYAAADAAAYAYAYDAAAYAAAYAAADAAARTEMRKRILSYGISLLKGERNGQS